MESYDEGYINKSRELEASLILHKTSVHSLGPIRDRESYGGGTEEETRLRLRRTWLTHRRRRGLNPAVFRSEKSVLEKELSMDR